MDNAAGGAATPKGIYQPVGSGQPLSTGPGSVRTYNTTDQGLDLGSMTHDLPAGYDASYQDVNSLPGVVNGVQTHPDVTSTGANTTVGPGGYSKADILNAFANPGSVDPNSPLAGFLRGGDGNGPQTFMKGPAVVAGGLTHVPQGAVDRMRANLGLSPITLPADVRPEHFGGGDPRSQVYAGNHGQAYADSVLGFQGGQAGNGGAPNFEGGPTRMPPTGLVDPNAQPQVSMPNNGVAPGVGDPNRRPRNMPQGRAPLPLQSFLPAPSNGASGLGYGPRTIIPLR